MVKKRRPSYAEKADSYVAKINSMKAKAVKNDN